MYCQIMDVEVVVDWQSFCNCFVECRSRTTLFQRWAISPALHRSYAPLHTASPITQSRQPTTCQRARTSAGALQLSHQSCRKAPGKATLMREATTTSSSRKWLPFSTTAQYSTKWKRCSFQRNTSLERNNCEFKKKTRWKIPAHYHAGNESQRTRVQTRWHWTVRAKINSDILGFCRIATGGGPRG